MKRRLLLLVGMVVLHLAHTNGLYSQIRIMPLGNSITQGVLGSSDDTGYRRALYLLLTAAGYSINFVGSQSTGIPADFDRDHEGHSGWRADQIRDNLSGWLTTNPADLILLHIGTNDISQGQTVGSTTTEVGQILDGIDAKSTATVVFLALIINRNDGYSSATSSFNAALQALANTRIANGDLIVVVNQEAALTYPSDLDDAVHPNNAGYAKMAQCWFTALSEYLHPVPTLSSIVPATRVVGDAPFSLTVNGTHFMNGVSMVNLNGSPRATEFVSSTQLMATIPATDLEAAGSRSITVVNAAPGGGTSSAQTLMVNKGATSTVLNGSPNPSNSGQTALFTATVTPSVAPGLVEFFDGVNSLGTRTITAGSATLAATLTTGVHSVRATYGGDANYLTSEDTSSQTVNPVIIAIAGANGSIDPSNHVYVPFGGSQTFSIVSNEGYHTVDVLVDAESQGAIPSYTFTGVTVDHTLEASFAINAYTITVTSGPHGTIAPVGPIVSVSHGDGQLFTMTPTAGYHVAKLTVDGVRVNPASTFTFADVTADHTIAAMFALDSYAIIGPTGYNLDVDGNSVTDMIVNIIAKPAGNATISAVAHVTPPAGAPELPPNGLPLYLDVTSSLPVHAFAATVRLDLDGIAGSGPSSVLAYYNQVTAGWVPVEGTYLVADALFDGHSSFTFQVDHFGAFAFSTPGEFPTHVYGSKSASVAAASTIYPNNSWRPAGPPYVGNDDWSWSGSQVVSVYLVPQAGSHFGSADITLEWDASMMTWLAVNFGSAGSPNGLYGSGHAYSSATSVTAPYGSGRIRIECSRDDNGNFSTLMRDYIARVDFTLLRPGHSSVAIIGAYFRILDATDPPTPAYLVPVQSEVNAYLGDIATAGDLNSGDGKVDFEDLVAWSYSYWAGVPGYEGSAQYKVKYDFGPTADTYIFSLPQRDGQIDFEDLLIFSIGYGQTAAHYLPKVIAAASDPLEISLGKPVTDGAEVRLPVVLGGGVTDVRGLRLEINGQFGSFLGAEKGDLLQGYDTPTVILHRVQGRSVYLDLAIMGLDAPAIDRPGEVAVLRFSGNPLLRLAACEGRNSRNRPLELKKVTGPGDGMPLTFALLQNYPNPFNPSTVIRYTLPRRSQVTLTVFNTLGQLVSTLINGEVEAGVHEVQFKASGLASGVYFYRLQAEDFTQAKKLCVIK